MIVANFFGIDGIDHSECVVRSEGFLVWDFRSAGLLLTLIMQYATFGLRVTVRVKASLCLFESRGRFAEVHTKTCLRRLRGGKRLEFRAWDRS